jgi:hypothetical protein
MQIATTTNTNLITNPNFETNTTGWAGTTTTLSQDATTYYRGAHSMKLVGAAACVATYAVTLVSGTTYSAQMRVKGTAGVVVYMQALNGATGSNFTLTGGWDLLTLTFTTTSTSSSVEIHCATSSITLHIDSVMLEKNVLPSNYFDGSFGLGYYWNGTANASTSFYRQFETSAANNLSLFSYGAQISFTKTINSSSSFWTIGTSTIGGPAMIMGPSGVPAFLDIFQYVDYSDYAMSWSVQKNIGQFPYGSFGAEGDLQLDNTSLLFLPNFDPTIGAYITVGRPVKLSAGYNGETMNLFTGTCTQPLNDVQNRTFTLQSFDGVDFLNTYTSVTTPIQVNVYADQIIAALLSEVGFGSSQYVAEQSLQQPIGFFAPYGLLVGDIIQALCEAEQALFFFDENGIAHFWNRQHIANNLTSVWDFDEYSMINVQPEETPIYNDVQIQANPRSVQAKQLVWQQDSATLIPASSTSITYTNLITNPNFETNVTGWTAVGTGTAIAQNLVTYYNGLASMEITGGTSAPPIAKYTYTYVSGQSYTAYALVKGTAGQTVKFYCSAGSLSSSATTLSGNWDTIQWTFTPTTTSGDLEIQGNTNAAILYVDTVMLQTQNISTTYFDGNTPYSQTQVFIWNGTPNASSSTAVSVGNVTISADFEDEDGALPVTSVDNPVYYTVSSLGSASNYTANFNEDGSGADAGGYVFITGESLTNSASSAAQLNGSNYQITFLNSATVPVYITGFGLYGTPAKVTYTINTEYSDPASVALYGTNPANNGQPLLIQNDLIQSPSTANSNAYQLVNDFAQPYQRLTADIFPVPQLQIGDTVTVTINDSNQTLYYTIVGISISSDSSTLLAQTLELEVRNLTKYFQVNVSQIGGTDQIAP